MDRAPAGRRVVRGMAGAIAGLAAGLLLLLPAAPAAAQFIALRVDVFTGCEPVCSESNTFGSIDRLIDELNTVGYAAVNDAYTPRSVATVFATYRGVDAVITYPTEGPELSFEIPATGTRVTFDEGATRAENEAALEAYLRNNSDGIINDLSRAAVRSTSTDPIAGNPNSLSNRMVESDFLLGTTIGAQPDAVASTGGGYDRTQRTLGFNVRFGRYAGDGLDSDVIDLPLTYVQPLDDPRYAVNFDAPLTYVQTEGAESYAGSFGLGVRLPLFDNWTLTPAVRVGFAGSFDLNVAQIVGAASVVSNYRFTLADYDVAIGNAVSYVQTFPVEVDGTRFDYDQQNLVLRNGIGISGPLEATLFGQKTTWELSVVNTQFLLDEVNVSNYFDIAFSLGTVNSVNGFTWDSVRIGVTYTVATDADYMGIRANFGYNF